MEVEVRNNGVIVHLGVALSLQRLRLYLYLPSYKGDVGALSVLLIKNQLKFTNCLGILMVYGPHGNMGNLVRKLGRSICNIM